HAMVKLVQNPKNNTTTDIAAPLLKFAYSTFPNLTLGLTSKIMEGYFKRADPMPSTTGNVLSPVKYGSSIEGGWQYLLKKKAIPLARKAAVLLAGLSVGLLILSKGR
ncbi:MAG: short-chain dehydrogenase, partial [Sphingobacteriaceae bacterium]